MMMSLCNPTKVDLTDTRTSLKTHLKLVSTGEKYSSDRGHTRRKLVICIFYGDSTPGQ